MIKTDTHIIPIQKTGGHTGAASKVEVRTRHEALNLFQAARLRLIDVNGWAELCGNTGAEFQLTDAGGGFLKTAAPKVGDLIRIKLPAPSNKAGDGFDWVRIEEFESSKNLIKDEELFGFRLRPIQNPANKTGEAAHFYTSTATSTLLVLRTNSTVHAIECGRNEVPNTVGSLLNNLRNRLVAIAAMIGLSTPQWKMLVKGILNPPKVN